MKGRCHICRNAMLPFPQALSSQRLAGSGNQLPASPDLLEAGSAGASKSGAPRDGQGCMYCWGDSEGPAA